MKRVKILLIIIFCAFISNTFAQECPKIYRSGDTLKTDPAGGYQWFLNGNIIPNATKQWHLGTVKGDYSVEVSGASPIFTVNNQGKSIYGRIIDERYEPLADAKITVGGKTVSSDNQGLFSLTNLDIKETTAVLTIEKIGFWKNTQRITFFDSKEANLTAMLEPLRVTNRFDAQKGTTISQRGFFLTFPPNSAVNDKGEIYTGTIHLSLKRAFPAEEGFGYRMPGGDFSAIDQNGQEKILVSYGFMSAEMQGTNGEKLNLAKDKEATLEFYIPWEQNKTAPDSMPLWHFDEATAVWKPEGTAHKVGPRYMGTVKHFSSWNIDLPVSTAKLKGKVVNCKKQPPSIRIPVQIGQRNITVDVGGYYTSFVPSETTFDVTANKDTATVTPLTEGEERTVKDLEANIVGEAIGLIDSSATLSVYGWGVNEYSIDGGNTFQAKSWKLNFAESTKDYPTNGVARDTTGCEAKFRIYILHKREDCQMLDSAALANENEYKSVSEALSATKTVYKLNFNYGDTMFFVLPCLQELKLSSSQLKSLSESIGQLNNLQKIKVSNGRLTSIHESIGQLINLRTLDLYGNKLTKLPESIGQLNNLQTLDLRYNQLTNLPESIGQLNKLPTLNLAFNKLTNLPESIGQLNTLQALDIQNNQLTSLPESIGQLSKLQTLNLAGNTLTSIPESIGQLINLQTLSLSSNPLTNLPESIGQLNTLQALDIQNNQLTSLPESIGQLNNLQDLEITTNPLTNLPESIGQLSNLQYLDLSYNQLTILPESIGQLSNLQTLLLNNNQLTILPESIGQLSNLDFLNLSYNKLTILPESIGQLTNLNTLFLDNNNLTSIPVSITNLKDTLIALYLENNNFSTQERAKIQSWLPNTTITW